MYYFSFDAFSYSLQNVDDNFVFKHSDAFTYSLLNVDDNLILKLCDGILILLFIAKC